MGGGGWAFAFERHLNGREHGASLQRRGEKVGVVGGVGGVQGGRGHEADVLLSSNNFWRTDWNHFTDVSLCV